MGRRQHERVCCPVVSSAWPQLAVVIERIAASIRTGKTTVPPVPLRRSRPTVQALDEADDQQDGEQLSFNAGRRSPATPPRWPRRSSEIAKQLGLPEDLQDILELAALWHDWGKSHPAFQGSMRGTDRPESGATWRKARRRRGGNRPTCTSISTTARPVPRFGTNSPAHWGCSPSCKPTPRSIRRSLAPGRRCWRNWASH